MVEGEEGTMAKVTNAMIQAAIYGFEAQKKDIDVEIAALRSMLTGEPSAREAAPKTRKRRKKISPEGIQRMREAQRLRWAMIKGKPAPKAATVSKAAKTAKTPKPKGGLTAAGRKALSLAMKKRWAAKKAAAA
jgi:hypothetical protein